MRRTCYMFIGLCFLMEALLLVDIAGARQLGGDRLGPEWSVTEGGIAGRWVRRGTSDTWDATWSNGAAATLIISISGDRVRISRKDVAGGIIATYEGTLATDGSIQGTETVTSPFQLSQNWQGRIVKG
jgi:hypothetical protein